MPNSVTVKAFANNTSMGESHSCLLTEDQKVVCWGVNNDGQLGNGTNDQGFFSPALVPDLGNVKAIAVGYRHNLALKQDGSLYCWGYNASGQCGVGSNSSEITTPTEVYPEGSQIVSISAGNKHSCVTFVDGSVECWGSNESGQLGINFENIINSNVPLPVVP
jgi:alpha-tubulin suppressor-like RCC1 family protein